jgi:hypothetical protein
MAKISAAFGRLLAMREQKMAVFRDSPNTAKSAGTLWNPCKHAGVGKKIPTGDPVGFLIWWRTVDRRESGVPNR